MKLFIAFSLITVLACSKKESGDSAAPTGSQPSAKPVAMAPPPAPSSPPTEVAVAGEVSLDAFGLHMDAPARTEVTEGFQPGEVIAATPSADFTLTVALAVPPFPKTLAIAKSESTSKAPTNMKEETLADGWLLTFESNQDSSFYLQGRREIEGKAFRCFTSSSTAAGQEAAFRACKSLRP